MENKENLWPGWDTTEVLGKGSYGSVYQIERHIPGWAQKEQAALKVMSIPQSQEDIAELTSQGYDKASITQYYRNQLDELIREYAIMLELKGHTNIVYCDEVKWLPHDDGIGWNVYIKMELLKPLKSVLGNTYDENAVIRLGRDIARALVHCQEKNVIHRDIKPQNILVSSKGDYKLGDFGVAKVSEKTTAGTIAGTYEYMAPEVFRGESYNSTADIYSLGIVMYWMMNNKRTPFLPLPPAIPSTADTESARTRRYAGEPLPEPVNGSDALKSVVLKACAYEPKDRYRSAEELLQELENLALSMGECSGENSSNSHLESGQTDASDLTVFGKRKKTAPDKRKKELRKYAWIACLICLCTVLGTFVLPNGKEESDIPYQVISEKESAATEETHSLSETVARMDDPLQTDSESTLRESPNAWKNNLMANDYEGQWTSPLFSTDITKKQIVSVTFLNTVKNAPSSSVDISEAGDGSVLAWVSGYDDTYELFLAGEGGVCAPENCRWLFGYFTNCRQFNFNGNFHTDYVKDMSNLFYGCTALTDIDISTLNTEKVENFSGMFGSCGVINLDLRTFDTSSATNLYRMFSFCTDLKNVDMSTWDTSKVTNMGWMFYHCTSLEQIDLSSFDTGCVTEFYRMFCGCSKLRSVNARGFDTSSATDMQEMFYECPLLQEMDLSHFDVSNVKKYNNFMNPSKIVNGKPWLKMFS